MASLMNADLPSLEKQSSIIICPGPRFLFISKVMGKSSPNVKGLSFSLSEWAMITFFCSIKLRIAERSKRA